MTEFQAKSIIYTRVKIVGSVRKLAFLIPIVKLNLDPQIVEKWNRSGDYIYLTRELSIRVTNFSNTK
jgi:hypothetical protein